MGEFKVTKIRVLNVMKKKNESFPLDFYFGKKFKTNDKAL
jgi:hypothetical protein